MKNTAQRNAQIVLMAMLITFGSCSDDDRSDMPTPSPDLSTSIHSQNDFLAKYMPQSEFYTIYSDTTIIGIKGTRFIYNLSDFKDGSGNNIAPPIEVEFKEMYDRKDMIFSSRASESYSRQLVSGGFFFLGATKNGSPISVGGPILEVPTDSVVRDMMLFIASSQGARNAWIPDTLLNVISISGGLYYKTFKPALNWINCDYFYFLSPDNVSLKITFSSHIHMSASTTYVVFKDINSAMTVYQGFGPNIDTWSTGGVAIGQQATLFSYTFDDGKLYMATKDIVTSGDTTYILSYRQVSEAELISQIQSF